VCELHTFILINLRNSAFLKKVNYKEGRNTEKTDGYFYPFSYALKKSFREIPD